MPALSFDISGCAAIETTRNELATDFNQASLPVLLHMMRLLNRSPQLSVIDNDYLVDELALRALILGSQSTKVVDLVLDYLNSDKTHDRWQDNFKRLNPLLSMMAVWKSDLEDSFRSTTLSGFLK